MISLSECTGGSKIGHIAIITQPEIKLAESQAVSPMSSGSAGVRRGTAMSASGCLVGLSHTITIGREEIQPRGSRSTLWRRWTNGSNGTIQMIRFPSDAGRCCDYCTRDMIIAGGQNARVELHCVYHCGFPEISGRREKELFELVVHWVNT